jgi:hypothetical protein
VRTFPLQTGQWLLPSLERRKVSPAIIAPVPWHHWHSASPDPWQLPHSQRLPRL